MAAPSLSASEIRTLQAQRRVGRLLAPIWVPVCVGAMRWILHWKVEGIEEARRKYAQIRATGAPLLICANHLTMVDSFVIEWALGSPWWYMRNYSSLAWNTPERENFASTWWKRALVWLMKCVPIARGGDRRAVGNTLNQLAYLMKSGEAVLVFPEGGRSRTGRVDTEAVTYGIGRLVKANPGCQVLCVYLRGEQQETWTQSPATGETFRMQVECFEPKTDKRGLRGTLNLNEQILSRLHRMEQAHFDGR
ncbi:MAG: 1-acyl-sn-glycerol-3-phosphate acyltransferase [Deltaproteobacteria bacterium]|nr:1-acyl-sn-glycerol-3-phosphate acyltransferase [Deltaproteobacteria bacterium]MBW2359474.1 1-acyl-sn-glycerol-3-phosphate acyltransferase [Deltaproteobacteria bacterium]